MKRLFLLLTICIFSISFSQEKKTGAIEIENGLLLYFNGEAPYTIELNGDVSLEQFPLIDVNGNGFRLIQNTVDSKGNDNKKTLEQYRKWEMKHINEMLPKKVTSHSEFLKLDNEVLSFWYYKIPTIKDAPKNVTPYKMTMFLDWKKDGMVYRIVHPTFSEDIPASKKLMLEVKEGIKYYSNEINLKRLYHSIKDGKNYYTE